MNKEIKEILDNLRFSYKQNKELYEKYNQDVMRYIIHLKEAKLLLDYITNLQEWNHNLLQEIEDMQNKNNKLIEENERYKRIFEGKERFSKIMPDDTDFIILSKADYDRQQEDIELGLINYKSRNEKAIEYILKLDKDYDINVYQEDKHWAMLLYILQGEDKE